MGIERFEAWWKAETTRRFLWIPACFAAGIGIYYALPAEPPGFVLPILAVNALLAAYVWRARIMLLPVLIASFCILFGGAYAQFRAGLVEPTMIHEALAPRVILGRVRDIERTERGVRLLLEKVRVDDLPEEKTPEQVRLSVKFKKDAAFELPEIGDAVRIRAGLMPAMGPALPNGFDFARYFYFRDIGAIGYGLPPWEVVGHDRSPGIVNRFWSWRSGMTDRIVTQLGTAHGGIAAGLITGDARAISEADFSALRASNLYHIIAISGEHMVVIAGVIFVGLRMLLLLLPTRISLRPEGKPVIAAVTLVLVTIYLFVTGLPMSAVRAYIMIALVLFAVIVRRQVDAMRSLAVTALLILLYDPTSLLDPGFELSFAATLALLALVDWRMTRQRITDGGPVFRLLRLLGTMMLVSLVAEAATMPLVISMFNNVSPYGVFANSLATPLVSFFLMPMVALFFILLPFGLQGLALSLMNYGIAALLGIGRWVAGFWHAQLFAPALPSMGLALFVCGLLWMCLWRTRVRRYGLIPALIGALSVFTVHSPDVLIGGNLKQVAFKTDAGYVLARGRQSSMVPELWANGLGYRMLPKAQDPDWRCDALGCVAESKGLKIAFPLDAAALPEDCADADIIVSTRSPLHCAAKAKLLDPKRLANSNVTALWIDKNGGFHLESSADWQGKRPWNVRIRADEDGGEE